MRSSLSLYGYLAVAVPAAVLACDSCYGPQDEVIHTRNVRRMQPGVPGATVGPSAPLEWGQLNFLHTTDTHGWLEGHLKEQNYGADWGDFVTFSRHMQQKAGNMGVDLLIIDTGDLHDGDGLSDATTPDGVLSNPIFDEVAYDVLTIGNHELYITDVAYETYSNFSKIWGDKYVTSNVQIINPATGNFEYIGQQYRYFTTAHGIRIMAFGVLYDFTGNSNVSKVILAKDLVQEQWFLDAINYSEPIDVFLLMGHNPTRPTAYASTFGLLHQTIRSARPDIPIQIFGGHSHIRDFAVFDDMSVGIESGRYCETLGWVSMSGINSSTYTGVSNPHGVPNPSRKVNNSSSISYSRRYLDWNRLTFEYHAVGSQSSTFDYHSGLRVTGEITSIRKELNLTALYGCAPQTWCESCAPFGAPENIFSLVPIALGATVINPARANIPRLIVVNTGSIRFDLIQGPFTYDDSFIVSPFTDGFQYIADVPYDLANQVLPILNNLPDSKKRDLESRKFGAMPLVGQDSCVDPIIGAMAPASEMRTRGIKRQTQVLTPGYTTTDDFGTDGDDTPHTAIPNYYQPDYAIANGSFPLNGSLPSTVDLVIIDFIASDVLSVLKGLGTIYPPSAVSYYMPNTGPDAFTTQTYLPLYAKLAWQANVPNCPVS